jgi:DNA-binding NarL/FixJ family response regulator
MTLLEMPRRTDSLAYLTARERDVLALVAEGHSNERIAVELGVTTRTVETHTSRIFAKLGLRADPGSHRRVLAVLVHIEATAALATASALAS